MWEDDTCLPDAVWLQGPGKTPRRMGKTLVACAALALGPGRGLWRARDLQCAQSGYRVRDCQTFLNRRGCSPASDAPVISSVRCSVRPPHSRAFNDDDDDVVRCFIEAAYKHS